MFHPLLENPAKLKDAELESKILDLSRKYHIASRMGQGGICQQIIFALEAFKTEQYQRQISATRSAIKKQDTDLDDLINVE